jgi:hypothetical protein
LSEMGVIGVGSSSNMALERGWERAFAVHFDAVAMKLCAVVKRRRAGGAASVVIGRILYLLDSPSVKVPYSDFG